MTSQLKELEKMQPDVIRICAAFSEINPQGLAGTLLSSFLEIGRALSHCLEST